MLIKIKSEKANFVLPFPNRVIVNRVSFGIILREIKKEVDLDESKIRYVDFLREYKNAKRLLREHDLPLVEVRSSDGEIVEIKL